MPGWQSAFSSHSGVGATQRDSTQSKPTGQSFAPLHSGPQSWLMQRRSPGQSELYWQGCPSPVFSSFSGSSPAGSSSLESAHVACVHTCSSRQSVSALQRSRHSPSTPQTWEPTQSALVPHCVSIASWHTLVPATSPFTQRSPFEQSVLDWHSAWQRPNTQMFGSVQSLLSVHRLPIAISVLMAFSAETQAPNAAAIRSP